METDTIEPWKYYLKDLENPPIWTEEEKKIIDWSICWEGSISLCKEREGIHLFPNIRPDISVTNTNLMLLTTFHKIVKLGHIYRRKRNNVSKHAREAWGWRCMCLKEVQYILSEILPYLPAKQEQCKVVLKFIIRRLSKFNDVGRYNYVLFDRTDFQYLTEIRRLNKRGIP